MITLDLATFFLIYLFVFLAVIFAAWLLFTWRNQTVVRSERQQVNCPVCGVSLDIKSHIFFVRCPHCGYRNRLSEMKIED